MGTVNFMSHHTMNNIEYSRRDDIIAIAYILAFLNNEGRLPWNIPEPNYLEIDMKDPLVY